MLAVTLSCAGEENCVVTHCHMAFRCGPAGNQGVMGGGGPVLFGRWMALGRGIWGPLYARQ